MCCPARDRIISMDGDQETDGSNAVATPRFVFIWQVGASQPQEEPGDALLIWPLTERPPAGAFARFVVVRDDWRNSSVVVPMDLEPNERPLAADGLSADPGGGAAPGFPAAAAPVRVNEDLGSLPLLLRQDFGRKFTVAVNYLIRRQTGRSARVELVETPAVEVSELDRDEAKSRLFIGFIRGKGSEGPARPTVMTGPATLSEDTPERGAPTRVDIADDLLRAYETSKEGEGRRVSAATVLAVPCMDAAAIGPVQTILPYAEAHVRVSGQAVPAAEEQDSDGPRLPRIGVRIGANSGNWDELEPGIVFFHWDRMSAAKADKGPARERSTGAKPLSWQRGTIQGREVAFTFEMAGFGDVVGVMVGPRARIIPIFPGLARHRSKFSICARRMDHRALSVDRRPPDAAHGPQPSRCERSGCGRGSDAGARRRSRPLGAGGPRATLVRSGTLSDAAIAWR